MRFLVEEMKFALKAVWSLCIEWQGLKRRSEVGGNKGLVSEPAVLKSGSGDSRCWAKRRLTEKALKQLMAWS